VPVSGHIDFSPTLCNRRRVKNGKRQTPQPKSNKGKSRGTAWAERTRAQCNTLTANQREKLLDRALKIAYGAQAEPGAVARH
jgi:hypothetical protein